MVGDRDILFLSFITSPISKNLVSIFKENLTTLFDKKQLLWKPAYVNQCVQRFRLLCSLEHKNHPNITLHQIVTTYKQSTVTKVLQAIKTLQSNNQNDDSPTSPPSSPPTNPNPPPPNKKKRKKKKDELVLAEGIRPFNRKMQRIVSTKCQRARINNDCYMQSQLTSNFISICENTFDSSPEFIMRQVEQKLKIHQEVKKISKEIHEVIMMTSNEELKKRKRGSERFSRKWSACFGYLSQAKGATGFTIDRGFGGRNIHNFDINNAELWQRVLWKISINLIKLIDPSFLRNEEFCIQVSYFMYIYIYIEYIL